MTTGVAQGPTRLGGGVFFTLLAYTGPSLTDKLTTAVTDPKQAIKDAIHSLTTPQTVIALVGPGFDSAQKVQQFLLLRNREGAMLKLEDTDIGGGIAVNPIPNGAGDISVYISDNVAGEGVIYRYEVDVTTSLPAAPLWLDQKQIVQVKGFEVDGEREVVLAGGLYFEHLSLSSVGFPVEKPPGCSTDLGLGLGRLWVVEYKDPKPSMECGACAGARADKDSVANAYRYRITNGELYTHYPNGVVPEEPYVAPDAAVRVPGNTRGMAIGADFVMPWMGFLRCKDSFAYQCRIDFVYNPLFDNRTNCAIPAGKRGSTVLQVNKNVTGAKGKEGVFYTVRVPKSALSLARTTDEYEELIVGFNGAASKRLERMTVINGDKEDSFFRIRVPVLNNTKAGIQRWVCGAAASAAAACGYVKVGIDLTVRMNVAQHHAGTVCTLKYLVSVRSADLGRHKSNQSS